MGSNNYRDSSGRPIVVATGLGIVTSLGCGKEDNWKKLTAGVSGIHQIKRFPTDGLKTKIAGTVDFLFDDKVTAPILSHGLATLAVEEAIAESGIGAKGDFPGPLFAAVPPVEMQWPQWRELAADCDPTQPVSIPGLIHAAESGKFRTALRAFPLRLGRGPDRRAIRDQGNADFDLDCLRFGSQRNPARSRSNPARRMR